MEYKERAINMRTYIVFFYFIVSLFMGCDSKANASIENSDFKYFVEVKNNKLVAGNKTIEFISFNVPNLNFIEDEMSFKREHTFDLPTEYEIRDALKTIKQMGGKVVRTYTIPVRKEEESKDIPKYVLGPGEFNEQSFQTMDKILAIANELNIRLIIPLLDNWKWMGGRPQYAAFRNKEKNKFWTDKQLKNDFKKTIKYVLNRKNTITGTRYKNDKAILCWETGNELESPQSWTRDMINYIKSIDKNHLVMDGRAQSEITEEELKIKKSDILTTHHYEENPDSMLKHVNNSLKKVKKSNKAYIIGEYGFFGTPAIKRIMNRTIENKYISGSLLWSLRFHREEGGFYWHSEPLGGGLFKSYHWPGFSSGFKYDEKNLLQTMRKKAYKIQNKPVPQRTKPNPPTLLPIKNVGCISWQGSVGASNYHIERSESKGGKWEQIGHDVSDANIQYYPLFCDESAKIGKSYYYRVKAVNKAGTSAPSNVVGPIKVEHKIFIDNMKNLMRMYHWEGHLEVKKNDDRKFKEDTERIAINKDDKIVYRVNGKIKDFNIYIFSKDKKQNFNVYTSSKGEDYKKLEIHKKDFSMGKGEYNYWRPILSKPKNKIDKANYLKLVSRDNFQISRIEIYYE